MIPHHEKKSIATGLSIDEGVPLGEVISSDASTVSVYREIDEPQARSIYSIVEKGFVEHNQNSLLKQDMTWDELSREAADNSVLKYLAQNDSAEVQGYLSVHSNLDDITWADIGLLKKRQESFGAGQQAFYVGTFVVPQELRGFRLSGLLLEAALGQLINFNRLNGNQSLCFFDRSQEGSAAMREMIDRKLKKLVPEGPQYRVEEIDTVHYVGVENEILDADPALASGTKEDIPAPHTAKIEKDGVAYVLVAGETLDAAGNVLPEVKQTVKDFKSISAENMRLPAVLQTRSEKPAFPHSVLDTQHFYAIIPPAGKTPERI